MLEPPLAFVLEVRRLGHIVPFVGALDDAVQLHRIIIVYVGLAGVYAFDAQAVFGLHLALGPFIVGLGFRQLRASRVQTRDELIGLQLALSRFDVAANADALGVLIAELFHVIEIQLAVIAVAHLGLAAENVYKLFLDDIEGALEVRSLSDVFRRLERLNGDVAAIDALFLWHMCVVVCQQIVDEFLQAVARRIARPRLFLGVWLHGIVQVSAKPLACDAFVRSAVRVHGRTGRKHAPLEHGIPRADIDALDDCGELHQRIVSRVSGVDRERHGIGGVHLLGNLTVGNVRVIAVNDGRMPGVVNRYQIHITTSFRATSAPPSRR